MTELIVNTLHGTRQGWSATCVDGQGRPGLRFESGDLAVDPPAVLDPFLTALMPRLIRAGGRVRVRGAVTRGAVRNLTEYADSWANWNPASFHRVEIEPDAVLDSAPPAPGPDAIVAWSRSLRSTDCLVRHLDGTTTNPYIVRAVLRIHGLAGGEVLPPDAERAEAAQLAHLGVTRVGLTTNACADGWIDPEIGVLPIVAASLQLVGMGRGLTLGLYARPWQIRTQLLFPRPGPALPDLLHGDRFVVRAEGGTRSLPAMAAAVTEYPELMSLVSGCWHQPGTGRSCGTCAGCVLTALAFRASTSSASGPGRLSLLAIARLPLSDPIVAADAESLLDGWATGRSLGRAVLALRQRLHQAAVDLRDHGRWLGAMAGLRQPWPR